MIATTAIIGGTGLTRIPGMRIRGQETPNTRWGEPSGPLVFGELGRHEVVFLHRHGDPSRVPPHRINYRANICALQQIGAERIVAVAAVGGIAATLRPGDLVLPHQIIDYTWGRAHTFYEDDLEAPVHIDFTVPYHETLRAALVRAGDGTVQLHAGGVYAATQGPRLESAAEIDRLERDGCDVVGMTGMPEAALAREAEIAYAHLAVVTNAAAGRGDGPITMTEIRANLETGVSRACQLLEALLAE